MTGYNIEVSSYLTSTKDHLLDTSIWTVRNLGLFVFFIVYLAFLLQSAMLIYYSISSMARITHEYGNRLFENRGKILTYFTPSMDKIKAYLRPSMKFFSGKLNVAGKYARDINEAVMKTLRPLGKSLLPIMSPAISKARDLLSFIEKKSSLLVEKLDPVIRPLRPWVEYLKQQYRSCVLLIRQSVDSSKASFNRMQITARERYHSLLEQGNIHWNTFRHRAQMFKQHLRVKVKQTPILGELVLLIASYVEPAKIVLTGIYDSMDRAAQFWTSNLWQSPKTKNESIDAQHTSENDSDAWEGDDSDEEDIIDPVLVSADDDRLDVVEDAVPKEKHESSDLRHASDTGSNPLEAHDSDEEDMIDPMLLSADDRKLRIVESATPKDDGKVSIAEENRFLKVLYREMEADVQAAEERRGEEVKAEALPKDGGVETARAKNN